MPRTLTQVFLSLGSNTAQCVDSLIDSSTILKKRRTLMYRHSLLFPSSVLAPQTNVPFPMKVRKAFTDLPEFTSCFMSSWSSCVLVTLVEVTKLSARFVGAFHTPRLWSTLA